VPETHQYRYRWLVPLSPTFALAAQRLRWRRNVEGHASQTENNGCDCRVYFEGVVDRQVESSKRAGYSDRQEGTWRFQLFVLRSESSAQQNVKVRDLQIFFREQGKLFGHLWTGRRQCFPLSFAYYLGFESRFAK
jgi:hypothetical protein